MATNKWFINSNNQVSGPLDEYDIKVKVKESPNCLIWGRGLSAWLPFDEWIKEKDRIDEQVKIAAAEEVKWFYQINDESYGPFPYSELIDNLKLVVDLNNVFLKTDRPNQEWTDIFSHMGIVDELGISRRNHPRVPIKGTFEGESATGPFSVNIITISEGGLGVNDAFRFQIGDRIRGTLKSENLITGITCTAEVVYVGADHYTGLKFHNIPAESRSIVVEYIKKFGNQT